MLDWLTSDTNAQDTSASSRVEANGFATQGIISGTRVASNLGWRAVEALAPGDKVLTFDNGMQTLVEVRREVIWIDALSIPKQHWSVFIPAGAMNNRCDLTMMPEQGIVVESDVADEAMGDPFAVLDAQDLVGLRGIRRVEPVAYLEVVTLVFAEEQVVYAEGGTLMHCPTSVDLLGTFEDSVTYRDLPQDLVALVVDELRLEDALSSMQLAAA